MTPMDSGTCYLVTLVRPNMHRMSSSPSHRRGSCCIPGLRYHHFSVTLLCPPLPFPSAWYEANKRALLLFGVSNNTHLKELSHRAPVPICAYSIASLESQSCTLSFIRDAKSFSLDAFSNFLSLAFRSFGVLSTKQATQRKLGQLFSPLHTRGRSASIFVLRFIQR